MNIFISIVVFIFFIVLLVVGVYNSEDVTVDLLVSRIGPIPMGAVIASSVIFGVAFACIIGVIDGIKIRIMNSQLRKQVGRIEEECDVLRLQLARQAAPSAGREEIPEPAPWRDSAPS